jgi:hypothetical protein
MNLVSGNVLMVVLESTYARPYLEIRNVGPAEVVVLVRVPP